MTADRREPSLGAWGARAATVAFLWSLLYGTLGVYWTLGGAGFPFGENDRNGAEFSLLAGAQQQTAAPVIALLCLLGAVIALAMLRPWGPRLPRPIVLAFAWVAAAVLLLVIPDTRLLATIGYLPALMVRFGFETVGWPVVNQAICIIGGVAWGAAALAYQRATGAPPAPCIPDHVADASGQARSAAGPPWATWVTYAAVLAPLPYAATRLAWALGIPLGISDEFLTGLAADDATIVEYSLGGMALVGACLTLGLIQRWGEAFPGWVPVLGGKRVPPALAIVPATLASIALIVGGFGLYRRWLTSGVPLTDVGWGAAPPALLFLPWGILLALATYAYAERRRCESAPADGHAA